MAPSGASAVQAAHLAAAITAMGILVLGLIAAIWAARLGSNFMDDLENPRPALAQLPVVDAPGTPRLSQRVVLAIVDGLRVDVSRELPFLTELRARGVDAVAASQYPTWSRPNYVNLLTGVPPISSGVRTNRYGISVPLDSIMDRLRAHGLRSGLASDSSPMTVLFLSPRAGLRNVAPAQATTPATAPTSAADTASAADTIDPSDAEEPLGIQAMPRNDELLSDNRVTYESASRALTAATASDFDIPMYSPWPGGFRDSAELLLSQRLDLAVMLIGIVDAAGHEHGGASPDYRSAAYIADEALRQVASQLDLTRDTLIVVADHGHTNSGGHGGLEREVIEVPLIAIGAGIKPGAAVEAAQLQDIAPTLGALLGVGSPQHALGRTLAEMLTLDDATRALLSERDNTRIRRNRELAMREQTHAAQLDATTRLGRLGVVAGAALAVVILGSLAIRAHGLRLDWRALAVSLPAFFVVYFTLLGTLGQRLSPSFLPPRAHISSELLKYAIAGLLVQLLFNWLALRKRTGLAERLGAASGVAWIGLLCTSLPVAILWAYYPPPYVVVPSPTMLVLVPALQIALATYAVGTAVTLLGEFIVYWARRGYRRRLA